MIREAEKQKMRNILDEKCEEVSELFNLERTGQKLLKAENRPFLLRKLDISKKNETWER